MNVSPLKGSRPGAVIIHKNITDRKLAEMAVSASESTIRSLLDSSTQSVVAVNSDSRIVLVNGCTEAMLGYTREELLGQRLEILIPEGLRARHSEHHRAYFANPQTRTMGFRLDLEGRRKDGTTFPLEIGLGSIQTGAGHLAVAFVSDITIRKRLEQAERSHAQELEALAAGLLTAQEEERRVSRDLRDQICQQLASLAIDIGGLAAGSSSADTGPAKLRALQARVVRASEETRHIAYELHPSVLEDLGLVASLCDLCRQHSDKAPRSVLRFRSVTLPVRIPREVTSCRYRVAQESLQNMVRHSGARHASLTLSIRKGNIVLAIQDDGSGFDLALARGGGGLGLIGMHERARLIKGKLTFTARAGGGTCVELQIPLSNRERIKQIMRCSKSAAPR